MNIDQDELIGFETLLPTEIIELLHSYKTAVNKYRVAENSMNIDDLDLDEYELAMAA